MTIEQYISSINSRFRLGNATEHTFRGDLQQLIEALMPTFRATNEPKRQACGAPDYIITKKEIPIGYIEAKDIGDNDLDGQKKNGNKEQFDRYKSSLENIIFTDYLNFHWYKDAELVMKVSVGRIEGNKIIPLRENFLSFELLLKEFCSYTGQTIKSPKKLAEMMAGKARMLANVIEKALNSDEDNQENSSLKDQFVAFRQILIHDIHTKGFADVYAQTIAYGMFAARLHDPSLPTFSRQEAAELIPKTNPFLRKLFQYVAGYDLDSRIAWIVDGLADVFRATDVAALLKNFGTSTQTQDPIIHFYETFLTAYDPALRKARGVWYTPHPVVNFIVRAIDDILKSEFGIAAGIADNSMTTIKVNVPGVKNPVEKQVHRIQFLDPATGTATFIAEIIKQVYAKFKGQEGIWSDYVEKHLIPRLNGFEILMASYAMAHLKLDLLLRETGYVAKNEQRFRIYLTNSLEEFHADTGTLFANWLSTEANEANHVKRDTPVMVVTGNPPYSVSSTNKSQWIEGLTADYKKDLNERNIQPLSDDYIKFIRFGQHFIDKNGAGILAYISNNSFIDGIIHRQMRKHLLESFDKIYILDLHGNSKKKEVCPDGSPDQNVFDIMQGVSINLFIKTGKKKKSELGEVFHFDLFGNREFKYEYLNENTLKSLDWKKLNFSDSNYFFIKKDFKGRSVYDQGFKVDEVFIHNNTGLNTEFDELAIQDNKNDSERILEILQTKTETEVIDLLNFKQDKTAKVKQAILDVKNNNPQITKIKIKPFEEKFCIYTGKSNGIMGRPRHEIMKHLQNGENLGLISMRQYAYDVPHHCYTFVSRQIVTSRLFMSNKGYCSVFPLYLYPNPNAQQTIDQPAGRVPNLNMEIVEKIASIINHVFLEDENIVCDLAEGFDGTFSPLDILDYIYAVLYSPSYREKYKEFLKIDFPRVPYPKDQKTFWQLVELGSKIRQIHLLESQAVNNFITKYPVGGTNEVGKVRFEISENESKDADASTFGKVWINDEQYFADVPHVAWEFYIGGYQPAQKWLKDRKNRKLEFDDILHYQKIIVALSETDRLMKEIDKIEL
jgi:hypothetical protein